jgi:hypothetical protein
LSVKNVLGMVGGIHDQIFCRSRSLSVKNVLGMVGGIHDQKGGRKSGLMAP